MSTQQNGRQIGDSHVSRLSEYLASVEREGRLLPRRSDGTLNLSEIARECEFDRQVLYKNPRCQAMIEQIGATNRDVPPVSITGTKPDPRDQRIRELERKNSDLQERVIELEKSLKQADQYRRFYEHALETGRNIIP
jgi:hypothetical protein